MEIRGDFLGFKFRGKHSSELGIVRVSNGSRYEENLHPEIQDSTTTVPGMDGEYYFGSTYGKKNISIEIAFDSLTEQNLRDLRRTFGTKTMGELIFDELPYKKYIGKIESPIELSYVCFDEASREIAYEGEGIEGRDIYRTTTNKTRLYKGEGTISLVCYFPFAKSVFKVLPESEGIEGYDNLDDWAISSGILDSTTYNTFKIDQYNNGRLNVYNAGDVETGFRLYSPVAPSTQVRFDYKPMASGDVEVESLVLNPFELKEGDVGYLINTDTGLIQGVSNFSATQDGTGASYVTSGNLYNAYVEEGYFFKLQPNIAYTDGAYINITGGNNNMKIFYDYLYF